MSGRDTLGYYAEPGIMTTAGAHADAFRRVPRDFARVAGIGHGLIVHEHMTQTYGVTLSPEERESVHLRPVERLLGEITGRDGQAWDTAREPSGRVAGNCRQFTVLAVAIMRAQGVPARARCGFGRYFGTGLFEDHWVCEYWHTGEGRWRLADAQIDGRQREFLPIDFDISDVPRDRFLVAGEAWARCRAGQADPNAFGLSVIGEAGLWWVAGNLMRDAAALLKVELLPWDSWGAMPGPQDPIDDDLAALFDRLAALTRSSDVDPVELRRLCDGDPRLRLPQAVRNELRGVDEPL